MDGVVMLGRQGWKYCLAECGEGNMDAEKLNDLILPAYLAAYPTTNSTIQICRSDIANKWHA